MRNPRNFRIAVGDISDALNDRISDGIFKYTIPLILDDQVIGSGTLATVDQITGIFTARHVADQIFEKRKGKYVHGFLYTAPDEQPVELSIKIEFLDCWRSEGTDNKFGPDLAFVFLPEIHRFTFELRRKKSFCPISSNPEKILKVKRRNSFAAVAGFVFEETKIGPPESGFTRVERPQGYAFIGGARRRKHQERKYDLVDLDGDRRGGETIPRNFRGVSGGGLWAIELVRRKGNRPGTEELNDLIFIGVAFYQLDPLSQNPRLRCHGPKSIYKIALQRIRKWRSRAKKGGLIYPQL